MTTLQPVRGTHDLLPDAHRRHRFIEETARAVVARYGFAEMATPVFEFTGVFARTLGETSDVVTKEMYSFEDRGGESLTLRPEGTAGIARAFISNKLIQELPLKLFYRGPMFRYERPQKGRQRQFHQIGVELLGVADPMADVDVIAAGYRLLQELPLSGNISLEVNSLGDRDSRDAYRAALTAFLSGRREALSEDSRARLDRNPLRVLDSKDAADRVVVADAPRFVDYYTDAARAVFEEVQSGLTALDIPFAVNPNIVRGLDYYSHTAFEFVSDGLGAQATVLAGGRYDGLIEQMGGPSVPGVGWAAGVERLALLLQAVPPPPRPVAVIPTGSDTRDAAMTVSERLRRSGLVVEHGYSGNLKKRLNRADKLGAWAAVILGADELARRAAAVRDLSTGTQIEVPLDALAEWLHGHAPSGD